MAFSFPQTTNLIEDRTICGDNKPDDNKTTSDIPEGPWKSLPVDVVGNIFYFLPNGDRFNASLVCQSWSAAFSCAEIWTQRIFRFHGYRKAQRDMESAITFSRQFGNCLQSVVITCEQPTFVMCKAFQKSLRGIVSK